MNDMPVRTKPSTTDKGKLIGNLLVILGVIVLFFAEDSWVSGDHGRGLVLILLGLVPLICGLWLRRKKPEGRV